jgi:4-hydroxybenzoate polyprenyltransferase
VRDGDHTSPRRSPVRRKKKSRIDERRCGASLGRRKVVRMAGLVWGIIVILFVLWLLGLVAHIGSGLIHLLLVVALVLLVYNIITGRGARI